MEKIRVELSDEAFEQALDKVRRFGAPTVYEDVACFVKDKATVDGNPGLMFTFSVCVDGQAELTPVSLCMTARNFMMISALLRGKYPMFKDWA